MYKKAISLVFICYFCEISAMRIVPFVHSFAPVKGESTIQYSLTNNSSEPIAFEVTVFKRKQNIKGEDILEKDEESFIVFPSQIIVPGHGSRNIKVKWVGNKDFQKNPLIEQAFRVSFEQFRIDFKNKREKTRGASLEIRLRMLASLYMTPKNTTQRLNVVFVREFTEGNRKKCLVRVKNDGTTRISTNEITNEIVVFGKKYPLSSIISDNDRNSVIMAQDEREFIITENSIKTGLNSKSQKIQ